jgi:hypothetical protein
VDAQNGFLIEIAHLTLPWRVVAVFKAAAMRRLYTIICILMNNPA